MWRKFISILLLISLLVPGALADVVTEQWTATPYASTVVSSDMSKTGDVAVFGYANGHIVAYNAAGDQLWDVSPFGAVSVTEILFPPETTSIMYARAGTSVKQLSALDGSTVWTKTITGLADFDTDKTGAIVVFVNTTHLTTVNSAGTVVGCRVVDQDRTGVTGNYGQVIVDPDGEWVVGLKTDASGTIHLYDYTNHYSASWLSGYKYRREHRIVGSSQGYLENYGINLTVYRTTGTTTGDKIYVGTDCLANYNDIRFVSKATGEVLQHAKTGAVTNGMGFTVKVPYLGKNANYDIYVYYGNPAATTDVSNWNGIVYEDIGWITPSTVLTNPSFETSGGWTTVIESTTYAASSGHTITLPDTSWATDGTGSLYIFGSMRTTSDDWSGSVFYRVYQKPKTSSPGGFGYYVFADAKVTTDPGSYWPGDTYVHLQGHTSQSKNTAPGVQTDLTVTLLPTENLYCSAQIYSSGGVETTAGHQGSVNFDNLRFKRWILYPPTHSTWGVVEQNYAYDTELKQTTTLGATILKSDMAWTGDVFAATTSARVYQVTVTGSTTLTTTYTTVTGTPYALKSASGANYIVEGRGTYFYLYRYTPTLDSSFSFGNSVDLVDLAEVTGDWAIAGSEDGTLKIFSKINSSEWYFAWSTTPVGEPSTVVFSERGAYFAYGEETTGTINFYSTVASSVTVPDIYTTIHVYRDGSPYSGAYVDTYYGGEYGSTYVLMENNKRTDSDGEFVLFGITGHYYQIDVKDALGTVLASKTIQISRTDYDKNIYIYVGITPYDEQISNKLDYGATYNETSGYIEIHYYDPDVATDEVSIRIFEISATNTYTEVYENTWYTHSVTDTFIANPESTYRVDITFDRDGKEYTETFICTPIGRWHMDFPIPAEVRVGCFAILLICILALFPPDYRGVGAVTGMGFNTYFYAIGALPNPWWLLAVGWIAAIFYLFGRVQDGGL